MSHPPEPLRFSCFTPFAAAHVCETRCSDFALPEVVKLKREEGSGHVTCGECRHFAEIVEGSLRSLQPSTLMTIQILGLAYSRGMKVELGEG